MESDGDMGLAPGASSSDSAAGPPGGGPPDGRLPGPPGAGDHLKNLWEEDYAEDHQAEDHVADPQAETPRPDCLERTSLRAPGGGSCTSRGKIRDLQKEVLINNTETHKSATVAAKAQKELGIAKKEEQKLSGVVTELQTRLDRLESTVSARTDRLPLELGSADS